MKIVIDARFFGEAGPGRYVVQLVKHLEELDETNQYIVYLKKDNYDFYRPRNKNFQKKLADYRWYSFSEQILFLFDLYRENFDLVHFTQINTPLFYLRPFVVTTHDTILHEFSMERGNFLRRLAYKLKRWPYFLVFGKNILFSQKILVPSQVTKDDLLGYYRIDPSKIVVTHEAVNHYPSGQRIKADEILDKYGIKKPFLLCLGSFYPHKNVRRLVEAFRILKFEKIFSGQLLLIGRESDFSLSLRREIEILGVTDIIFPGAQHRKGYLADVEVEAILSQATVYIQPALKEGFGIPPVEAMVFGVPTAVSDIPCLREMCGSASAYFDPRRVVDMAGKIKLILNDESVRNQLIKNGFENVRRFSWKRMAEQTLAVYKGV